MTLLRSRASMNARRGSASGTTLQKDAYTVHTSNALFNSGEVSDHFHLLRTFFSKKK